VRSWNLHRKLVTAVLVLFLVPTVVTGAAVFALYRRGALADPTALALVAAIGFAVMMGYVALVAHGLGRALVGTLREIQRGAELIATVNPDHRLTVRSGDEMEATAEEINRLAERLRDARRGAAAQVEQATRELELERSKLSAILAGLDEGIVVTTPEGVVTLSNLRAQELLGAPPGGMLGRSLFDFVDRSKVEHFLDRLRAGHEAAARFTLHPPGGAVLAAGMTPFTDPEGRRMGILLALRDLSRAARDEERRQLGLTQVIRELRGSLSSIRSLSESLLAAQPADEPGSRRRLLEAVHAEALKLSDVVVALEAPGRLGIIGLPWHFEEIEAGDLLGLVLKQLADGAEAVHVERPDPIPIRAEISALSAALAYLVRRLLAARSPGTPLRLAAVRRGAVTEIEAGAPGPARPDELEPMLDGSVAVGVAGSATVREILARHAAEAWAFSEAGVTGFRVWVPSAESPARAGATDLPRRPEPAPKGAGISSAWPEPAEGAGGEAARREDLYDFSLMDVMERHVSPTDRERLLEEVAFVVLDAETTGLRPDGGDQVVSLAGVRVRKGVVRRAEVFDALVNPGRAIPAASTRFHGITEAMVAAAPPLDAVLPAFTRFAEGSVLAGHEVWFDLRFLEPACARLGLPSLSASHAVLDVRILSRLVHGAAADHDLDALAARLGVPIRGRHSALGDALATAEVIARLLPLLHKRGVCTLGDALDAMRRAGGRRGSARGAPGGRP
jgi:DNA polymerase-3 subunit epsilon